MEAGGIGRAGERDRTSDLLITNELPVRSNLLIINMISRTAQSIVLTYGAADTPFLSKQFWGTLHCPFSPAGPLTRTESL